MAQMYANIHSTARVTKCVSYRWECDYVSSYIGSKLQSLRKARGYSQQFVADKLDIKRSTLSNYEIGRRFPSLTDLGRLAEFYGVGLDYFELATADETQKLLTIARDVFLSEEVCQETKDEIYREIAMLYLKIPKAKS